MQTDRPTFLNQLNTFTPPRELSTRILERVEMEKRRIARIRLAIFSFFSLGSCLAFVSVARYAGEEFVRSGFTDYFSLLFSDAGAVLPYWREFFLSLVESLPILLLATLCIMIFIFLGSLRLAEKNMRTAFLSTHHSLRYE